MAKRKPETRTAKRQAQTIRRELGYYNEEEYRSLLGVTLARFRNKESAGELAPCSKLGNEKLYRVADVEAWIARRRVDRRSGERVAA